MTHLVFIQFILLEIPDPSFIHILNPSLIPRISVAKKTPMRYVHVHMFLQNGNLIEIMTQTKQTHSKCMICWSKYVILLNKNHPDASIQ